MFDQITTVVITVAIAALVGGGAYLVHRARASAREFSRLAFGTDSLREGIERMNYEHEHTPKSVSSATSLYLPRIHADFPEFDFEDMRARAENVIVSYLMAIDAQDASLLVEGSDELVDALRMKIDLLKDARQSEQYDKVSVHRTAISRYERRDGWCAVTFQSSVQYKYALFDDEGRVLKGNPETWTQERFNAVVVYLQDRDLIEGSRSTAWGLTCPNCGAAIESLGAKKCAYCGTPVREINVRVWAFHKVERA